MVALHHYGLVALGDDNPFHVARMSVLLVSGDSAHENPRELGREFPGGAIDCVGEPDLVGPYFASTSMTSDASGLWLGEVLSETAQPLNGVGVAYRATRPALSP